ncbi:MAG: SpoIIE family protein phosphatase [Microcoleus sp. PH2017_10_PVI_O_A]|uniref:SpoIIE family protein phosphatase n=1 Tax=unclassified Microcoleus TaxID=2642155 RepID=UPI001E05ADD5|nr:MULTISPECIES: SpoIIE family protein phosphatase [unclassified Microcoleus]TAE82576.1 MAG: HAMP domain-containing protein [Oscillatoriales cyanobacterium]MCC3406666.1 SpoIIE family protein phosphatase [Microcoleus sp. PH2017_10_PVI_O_A]MCC3462106.1 SpoIIE family protein phosphatase [Microcoleus sp. PH2017_11_PCY_U_A]MCC3479225.1 SpoIIE family protein phosphatase [Microcoleus sp. PH2017_12_PCY_D_A]MCC3529483.1 SpoIIE family protein phosphatase [Microcoleus sp. PH2017_21_RUC_O_A]
MISQKRAIAPSRPKFGLRRVLVVPFVLQIVAAVGWVGYLSYRNGEKTVNDLASQLQYSISARVYDRVQHYIETPPLVNQLNHDAVAMGQLDFDDLERSRPYLWNQLLRFSAIGHAGIANEKGEYLRMGWVNRLDVSEKPQLAQQLTPGGGDLVYYNLDPDGNPLEIERSQPNYDVRTRPFYTVVVEKKQAAWSDVYINLAYGTLQINASQPYYDPQGKLIGVLTCRMGLDQIRAFLQTLSIGKSGQVFIIEPDGKLIASSLKNQALSLGKGQDQKRIKAQDDSNPLMSKSVVYLLDSFQRLDNIKETVQLNLNLNSQRQFLQVSPLTDKYGLNWLIVVVVPESDFMSQVYANTRNTILLCIATLIVSIAVGFLSADKIIYRILQIAKASENIAGGDLNQNINPSRIFELETLANSFNSMARQLKESFETLEDKVTERTSEIATAHQEIAALNKRLKAENRRMSSELGMLRQMQQLILPKPAELAAIADLDIAGFMEPADEVGGDYYDVLYTEGIVTVAIGDVTGHGLESGILMVMAQTAVRTLQEMPESDPVRFLDTLNRTIYQNIQRMNSDKNLTLSILSYADGTISISGQHEEAIVVRKSGKTERIDTINLGFPIGLDENISELINQVLVELEPGDGVVLYTDGISEARNINKKFYGIERLCEVVSVNWHKSAEQIKQSAIDDLREFIGEQKVFDDITLVVLKKKD